MPSFKGFTSEVVDKRIKEIIKDECYGKSPVKYPKAILLGGQPASGKTTIQNKEDAKNPNILIINGDEYRKYHSNFTEIQKKYGTESVHHTQPFANAVVEGLIDRLSDEKYHLIIEGTLRNIETQLNTCKMLKEKGYVVELHVMAVNKEHSWQGTINRYNAMKELGQTPRATPKSSHDETVDKLPTNVSIAYTSNLFSRITLVTREGFYLYDSDETPDLNPQQKLFDALQL